MLTAGGYNELSKRVLRSRENSTRAKYLTAVFVVDDDIAVRESLEFLILNAGRQVETFTSAGSG